jgi:hypothetical protein
VLHVSQSLLKQQAQQTMWSQSWWMSAAVHEL